MVRRRHSRHAKDDASQPVIINSLIMKKYLVYPIENFCIEDAVHKEMRVDSVLFVDTKKFKNSYRRFGIRKKALDELDEKLGEYFFVAAREALD